ncbi:MAG: AAA family ATPase, partial [Olsenella sp.]|nr:AAA family ATPase [Olsenella sp.]
MDLRLAALTGVQRVSKESIFSNPNNFTVDTALDHQYAEALGFTQAEVDELLARLGRADRADEVARWYDGYPFGGEAAY